VPTQGQHVGEEGETRTRDEVKEGQGMKIHGTFEEL
jgi:hypothetical protein